LNNRYVAIHEFCKELSLCSRGHAVFHGEQWFNVYCFSERGDAETFMQRFGGEWFDPRQRAKIGLQKLAYNIRRFVTLERMAAA
jgi:hypothetical protein